ncbi:alcohol dehydrogenase catalytic domain-containing protein [Neptuniibacter sp. QD37_11]|uniref:alcohol dehydrogenase catalytic domain-containing protein n=1 Tax=Neptuniibacter sp. QD37_11 TaxID=3398209 RepID=UPI0039F4F5E0
MKALTFDKNSDSFIYKDIPVPRPSDGEILIKVSACGLNPVDAKIRLWKSMIPASAEHWVPGLDIAGEIVEVGDAVNDFSVGDKVLCHGEMLKPHGGFTEYSVQSASTVIKHPDLEAIQAAAIPCAGWTAWRALVDKLDLTHQDSLFIAGGAGGVGSYAIQIANHIGAKQIITTASAPNHDYLYNLGATHVVDYKNSDVIEEVMQITHGLGVSKGLDAVGGDNDILVANLLKFEGEMVELVRTLRPEQYQDAFIKGLSFHQLSLGSGHRNGEAAKQKMICAGLSFTELVASGAITLPSIQKVEFDDVAAHLDQMLQQRTVGKLVMAF